jgi:hypothetical protein
VDPVAEALEDEELFGDAEPVALQDGKLVRAEALAEALDVGIDASAEAEAEEDGDEVAESVG